VTLQGASAATLAETLPSSARKRILPRADHDMIDVIDFGMVKPSMTAPG
jgi:hypothetical protein